MPHPATIPALVLVATLAFVMPFAQAGTPTLDFSDTDLVREFRLIDDAVMGGVSASRLVSVTGAMTFEGNVSLENNGGFASFRGPARFPAQAGVLLLTVRGDGQRYKLTLRPDERAGSSQYQATFTAPRQWQTLRFEPASFTASFRGRPVTAPILRFADMRHVGVLISDRQAGPFRIELRDIRVE